MNRSNVLESACFAVLQFLFWSGITCFEAFLVPYLSSLGYTPGQIGAVMSAIFGFAVIGQPLLGSVSDRVRSPRYLVAVALAVSGCAALVLPTVDTIYWLVIAVALVYSLTANSLPAILDGWILERGSSNRSINYGILRGFGSAGFAVTGIVLGVATERYGLEIVFPAYFSVAVAAALVTLAMPRRGRRPEARNADTRGVYGAVEAVLRNGAYLVLVSAAFLAFTGLRAGLTFLPLLIDGAGGSLTDVGLAQSIGAVSEIPVFFLATPILRRFRTRRLVAAILMLLALRLAAYPFLPAPAHILAMQVSHGVTFGLFLATTVNYIHQIAPPSHRGFFQALAPSVYLGLGSIVGSWLGGIVVEAYSTTVLFVAAAVVALLAVPLFVLIGRPNEVQ